MGEEEKKPEEKKMEEKNKAGEEEKKEQKKEEKKSGEVKEGAKSGGGEKNKEEKEEGKEKEKSPPPPQEIILKVYMHCEGCARKVRRCLKGFEGVEDVITDCKSSKVTVKGEKADPLKVLERVQRKSHRQVELISPIPKPPSEEEKKPKAEKEKPKPEEKKEEPQVVTVVLKVYMHCEACAQEIKKRILRVKGVESAEPDLKSSQVKVKGALDPAKLVEYLYKRTGKHAVIVKQDPDNNNNAKKDKDEKSKLGNQGDQAKNPDQKKTEENGGGGVDNKDGNKKGGDAAASEEANKKDKESAAPDDQNNINKDVFNVVGEANKVVNNNVLELRRNEYFNNYPPMYAMDLYANNPYPPQIFSDENPNACSVM